MMTSFQLLLLFLATCTNRADPDTFGRVPIWDTCLLMYAGVITG